MQDVLEVREGPEALTAASRACLPAALREATEVLPQVPLCGLSVEGRLGCEPRKTNNLFNF